MQAGGISIHAVDVAAGAPATGLMVTLHRLDSGEHEVASGMIGSNGLLDHPTAQGHGITAGAFEARFAIGDYLRARGVTKPFLDIVPFRFVLHDISQHIHLPLKFTPYGYSLFRGAWARHSAQAPRQAGQAFHQDQRDDCHEDHNAGHRRDGHIKLAFQILPHPDRQHVGTGIAQEQRNRHIIEG